MHASSIILATIAPLLILAGPIVNLPTNKLSNNITLPLALPLPIKVRSSNNYDNNVILIRHGEKPSDGGVGLSSAGEERAQCLRTVFGANSGYNIQYIIAEGYLASGKRERAYETVKPLADDLGLTVDVSCDKTDDACVANLVSTYAASANSADSVLIAWEHNELTPIAAALGIQNPPTYPDGSYDIIWHLKDQQFVDQTYENCPQDASS